MKKIFVAHIPGNVKPSLAIGKDTVEALQTLPRSFQEARQACEVPLEAASLTVLVAILEIGDDKAREALEALIGKTIETINIQALPVNPQFFGRQ